MTNPAHSDDAIDAAIGVDPGSHLYDLRAQRPDYVAGAQACRAAVLWPGDDLGLSRDLRLAIALRVGLRSGRPDLLTADVGPAGDDDMIRLAEGDVPVAPFLAAIAEHADLIATDPGRSDASDLEKLRNVSLSTAQIVALSELLAYACFHIRVAHGLSLLKDLT